MADPTTTAFSVVSFITAILVAIPFAWHLEAWNTGTCMYMAWTSLGCLNLFINSVIWRGSIANVAPVWCDISSKFMVGTSLALPAASLCINRRLYHIATIRKVTTTFADGADYIVQGHRFDIFEDMGCMPFTYNTPLAYVLVQAPILAVGLTSATYAGTCAPSQSEHKAERTALPGLSIVAFKRRTVELRALMTTASTLNPHRYMRLMFLAGVEIAISVPTTMLSITAAAQGDVEPWISWENVHEGFSRVDQIPGVVWRSSQVATFGVEETRWGIVGCGLVFFMFFGFAQEARNHYGRVFRAVARRLGVASAPAERSNSPAPSAGSGVLVKQEVEKRRDSVDSMSARQSFRFQDLGGLLADAAVSSETVDGKKEQTGEGVAPLARPPRVGGTPGSVDLERG
ncbi:hypothetical protein H0H81_000357, partial [Sphagnurus paluster]